MHFAQLGTAQRLTVWQPGAVPLLVAFGNACRESNQRPFPFARHSSSDKATMTAFGVIRLLTLSACGVAVFSACTPRDRSAKPASSAATGTQQHQNELLSRSASPFEDLTEFAIAGDRVGMGRALTEVHQAAREAVSALTPGGAAKLDSLVLRIDSARQSGNFYMLSLEAVEAYRILVDGLDEAALTVPKPVSLLDYAGFRLTALTSQSVPDWTAVRITANEARQQWSSIASTVQNQSLKATVNTAMAGMTTAVDLRDAQMTLFAAQVTLDLVDLLEAYFNDASRTAP